MNTHWQPTATIAILKRRAQLLADVRRFFADRGVLEVETPIMSHAAPTAPYLDSFTTPYQPAGGVAQTCYLQTSPEFAMKRLLASGCGDIFQIARVFRNGELGRLHSPEFTMLEWYRPALAYFQLMDEVDDFMQQVAGCKPALRFRYRQLFEQILQLDCMTCDTAVLQRAAFKHIASLPSDWLTDRDGWLELLMSEVIEPQLAAQDAPVIVYDFPASQAQLAKLHQDEDGQTVATRFELYAGGMELANGYDELLDANELRQRFEQDNRQREQQGKAPVPIDENLLAAMNHGLPQCTGIALGMDRLLMLVSQSQSIQDAQSISFERS